jgi:hypothetical protein
MAASYMHGNGPSGSIKDGASRTYNQLLKKDSAPWSYLIVLSSGRLNGLPRRHFVSWLLKTVCVCSFVCAARSAHPL